jgi:hypothetical protein
MKRILFLGILILSTKLNAQVPNNTFYGLARKNSPNNEIFLATMNPTTGVATNISPLSLSPIVNLTGAALDPYRMNYHFIGYNEIKTINLTTGLQTNSKLLNNPIANSYFDNFRFNNSDSTLYGLARRYIYDTITMVGTGELYLSSIDPSTGTISQISSTSIGQGYALAGSAIDPYQMVYYFSTGANIVGLDMYNGSIYSNMPIQINGGGKYFDNFTYSCADTGLYGLIRTNYFSYMYDSTLMDSIQILDSTSIHLGKINSATGLVTTISPYSIAQGGYTLNAGSTIDPSTMIFYYNNGYELVGVSLNTGLIVTKQPITNTNGQFFELMRIQSNCFEATTPTRLNSTTGITKIQSDFSVNINPNPVTDLLTIEALTTIDKIEIINTIGQTLLEIKNNTNKIQVNMINMPVGIYFVKCFSKDKLSISKVVK